MNDLISREAALEEIGNLVSTMSVCVSTDECRGMNWMKQRAIKAIENLPTAEKVGKWIPANERLPKNDDWVIVTILDERGDTPFRYTDFGWYIEAANCWIVDAEQRTDVTAWMPLPEPWRGEEDDSM